MVSGFNLKSAILVSGIVLASTNTFAASLEEMKSLSKAGEYKKAYAMAQELLPEMESDPDFDEQYGTLALRNGDYNEARFALERVVIADGGRMGARLSLAKVYMQLGDKNAARKQLEIIKDSDPPISILNTVNAYLSRLGGEQLGQGVLKGFVDAMFGYDNNVNQANSKDIAIVPNVISPPNPFAVMIAHDNRRMSDAYDYVGGGLDYAQSLNEDWGYEIKGRVNRTDYLSSDRFDKNIYSLQGGLDHVMDNDIIRLNGKVQDYRLSDSDYQKLYGVQVDWLHMGDGDWNYDTGIILNEVRYPDDKLLDVHQYIGYTGIIRQFGNHYHNVGVLIGEEEALHKAGKHNAKSFDGVFYNYQWTINGDHTVWSRLYYQLSENDGKNPVFLQTNNERFQSVTLGWNWHLTDSWRIKTEAGYQTNVGDINLTTNDGTYIQTGVRYSF